VESRLDKPFCEKKVQQETNCCEEKVGKESAHGETLPAKQDQ